MALAATGNQPLMTACEFPIIPCESLLCGTTRDMRGRNIKEMLKQWDKEIPGMLRVFFVASRMLSASQLRIRNWFHFRLEND